MKLKSKLIATIVSITAAIAVMGVGVWAAQSSFSVGVQNSVQLRFSNISGNITVNASAAADVTKDNNTVTALNAGLYMYEAADFESQTKYAKISADTDSPSALTPTERNKQWDGVKFLTDDYITANTRYAYVDYTFTYELASGLEGSGNIAVKVDDETAGNIEQDNFLAIRYFVRVGGTGNWTELADEELGSTLVVGAYNAKIEVRVIAQYVNSSQVSVDIYNNGAAIAWNFVVTFSGTQDQESTLRNAASTIEIPTSGTNGLLLALPN